MSGMTPISQNGIERAKTSIKELKDVFYRSVGSRLTVS